MSDQIAPFTDHSDYMLADRAYDDEGFRIFLESKETVAVIPSKKNRLAQIPHEKHIYKG
jgi:hypothetical protein